MGLAENNEFPSVLFAEQGGSPSTPAAGFGRIFIKTDGVYFIDDDGVTVGPLASSSAAITRSQLGTTSAGGSFRTTRQVYLKKVTMSSAGLLASISCAVKGNGTNAVGITAAVMSDNSGTPLSVIAVGAPLEKESDNSALSNLGLSTTVRYIACPIGQWLTAADYWLCVLIHAAADSRIQIAYTGSGSDWNQNAKTFCDQSFIAATSTSDNYSIFADVLR